MGVPKNFWYVPESIVPKTSKWPYSAVRTFSINSFIVLRISFLSFADPNQIQWRPHRAPSGVWIMWITDARSCSISSARIWVIFVLNVMSLVQGSHTTVWSPDVQCNPITLVRYLFSLICSSSELSRKRQRLKKSKNARWETVWVITSFSVNDFKSSIKSFDMFTSHVQRALSRTLSL